MPRIRTLKPDLPQRADLGACSRDARLLFLLLKTLVDDDGRARGGARLLASLLFPYDDPAELRVGAWLSELAAAGLLVTYRAGDGAEYVQLTAFRADERIDHPTASKLPAPPADATPAEPSLILANIREASETLTLDRIGKDRIGEEGKETRAEGAREASRGLANEEPAAPVPEPIPAPATRRRRQDPEVTLRALADELLAEYPDDRVDLLLHYLVWPAAVDYFAVRRRKRCPETPRAWHTLLGRLAELGGNDPVRWAALLAHNATAGYMTIYPDAEAKATARGPKTTRTDAYHEAARRLAGA